VNLKRLSIAIMATLSVGALSGCAERIIQIIDPQGKVVGECNAGYDWHLYGLQDSIDYMLYQCAKADIAKGNSVSDERLLILDFTLPEPPPGKTWNKKLAMDSFHDGKISERKLGYVLAEVEFRYMKAMWKAEDDLAEGKISKEEFEEIEERARKIWQGE